MKVCERDFEDRKINMTSITHKSASSASNQPKHWEVRIPETFVKQAVRQLSPSAFAVYMVIECYRNVTTQQAFPGFDRLCSDTGFSRSTVKRCVGELVRTGYMLRRDRPGFSPIYTLPRQPIRQVGSNMTPVQIRPEGGAKSEPGEGSNMTPKLSPENTQKGTNFESEVPDMEDPRDDSEAGTLVTFWAEEWVKRFKTEPTSFFRYKQAASDILGKCSDRNLVEKCIKAAINGEVWPFGNQAKPDDPDLFKIKRWFDKLTPHVVNGDQKKETVTRSFPKPDGQMNQATWHGLTPSLKLTPVSHASKTVSPLLSLKSSAAAGIRLKAHCSASKTAPKLRPATTTQQG